jgi:hypothetical protein
METARAKSGQRLSRRDDMLFDRETGIAGLARPLPKR